ncbi:MAG: DUF4358 domain-containing protein [Oscillospiraceae bacterium]|nr:DUF4358 domain-containing protein [Oscillospiraceae bacterium]
MNFWNKLHRRTAFFLALVTLLSLLAACGGKNNSSVSGGGVNPAAYSAKAVADTILAVFDPAAVPDLKEYFPGTADPAYIGYLINGNYEELAEMADVLDFAIYFADGHYVFEVDVFKFEDAEKASAVKKLLEDRLAYVKQMSGNVGLYNPEQMPILDSAQVIETDNFIVLLATPDNTKAKGVVDDIMSGNVIPAEAGEEPPPTTSIFVDDQGSTQVITAPPTTTIATTTGPPPTTSIFVDEKGSTQIITQPPTTTVATTTGPPPTTSIFVDAKGSTQIITQPPTTTVRTTSTSRQQTTASTAKQQTTATTKSQTTATTKPPVTTATTKPPTTTATLPQTDFISLTICKNSRNNHVIIGGSCEPGSAITVTGGASTITTNSDFGNFIVEVPIKNGTTTLSIIAVVPGKSPSDTETVTVKSQTNVNLWEQHGICATIVGAESFCYFVDNKADYERTNLINQTQINQLKDKTQKRLNDLKAKGCNAEIIYFIIPNPTEIYPEVVTSEWKRGNTSNSLLRQFSQAVRDGGGTVIDLTNTFMARKNDSYKLYHKTDSHWTEYGALIGYEELMKHIGGKYPAASPRPRSDFTISNKQRSMGDIWMMFNLDNQRSSLRETTAFVDFKFVPPGGRHNVYMGNNISIDHAVVGNEHSTNASGSGLPSAYIFRDSFGGPFYDFLTDRFSSAYWREWGKYSFNLDDIAARNPNYIIYTITERNIRNIIWE